MATPSGFMPVTVGTFDSWGVGGYLWGGGGANPARALVTQRGQLH